MAGAFRNDGERLVSGRLSPRGPRRARISKRTGVSTGSDSDRVSPRSGRQRKAWGASPRIESQNNLATESISNCGLISVNENPRDGQSTFANDSAVARSAGLANLLGLSLPVFSRRKLEEL